MIQVYYFTVHWTKKVCEQSDFNLHVWECLLCIDYVEFFNAIFGAYVTKPMKIEAIILAILKQSLFKMLQQLRMLDCRRKEK